MVEGRRRSAENRADVARFFTLDSFIVALHHTHPILLPRLASPSFASPHLVAALVALTILRTSLPLFYNSPSPILPLSLQQMEISKYLRDTSRTIEGKQQLIISSFAKALEVIPRQICDNAGIDATDVLNKLRMLHARGERWAGVDVENDGVADNMEMFVWEPALVKINALEGAAEAACLVLSVDETVTNPSSQVGCRLSLFSFLFSVRRSPSLPLSLPSYQLYSTPPHRTAAARPSRSWRTRRTWTRSRKVDSRPSPPSPFLALAERRCSDTAKRPPQEVDRHVLSPSFGH